MDSTPSKVNRKITFYRNISCSGNLKVHTENIGLTRDSKYWRLLIKSSEVNERVDGMTKLADFVKRSELHAEAILKTDILDIIVEKDNIDSNSDGPPDRTDISRLIIAAMTLFDQISKYSLNTVHGFLAHGCFPMVIKGIIFNDCMINIKAVRILYNLTKYDSETTLYVLEFDILICFVMCLRNCVLEVKLYATKALHNMCKLSEEILLKISESGCFPFICPHIYHPNPILMDYSLAIVEIIHFIRPEMVASELGVAVVDHLVRLLKHDNSSIRLHSARLLSQMTDSTHDFHTTIMEKDLIYALINVIRTSPPDTYRAAIIAISNIVHRQVNARKMMAKGHFIYIAMLLHRDCSIFTALPCIYTLYLLAKKHDTYAKEISKLDLFLRIIEVYKEENCIQGCDEICHKALGVLLPACNREISLQLFFIKAPNELLKYCLKPYSELLRRSDHARRWFVWSDGLRRLYRIFQTFSCKEDYYIYSIVKLYPKHIVRYYEDEHFQHMMKKCFLYQPDFTRRSLEYDKLVVTKKCTEKPRIHRLKIIALHLFPSFKDMDPLIFESRNSNICLFRNEENYRFVGE